MFVVASATAMPGAEDRRFWLADGASLAHHTGDGIAERAEARGVSGKQARKCDDVDGASDHSSPGRNFPGSGPNLIRE
jgi:hypothetical protein